MEKLVVLGCLLLLGEGVFGQNRIVEQQQRTENGVTKGWTITKELDADGNVVSYDSTYFERDAEQNSDVMEFNFEGLGEGQFHFYNYGGDSTNVQSFFHNFGFSDSLFKQHMSDFDKLIEDYMNHMNRFYTKPVPPPPDSTQFVYPENGSPSKKI